MRNFGYLAGIYFLTVFFFHTTALALSPDEVMVIANKNAAGSTGLAAYYMEQRNIPKENLVQLWMTDKETCSREDYEKKAAPKIRRALSANPKIRAAVTMFGVPLRISGPKNTAGEEERLAALKAQKESIQSKIDQGKTLDEKALAALKKERDKADRAYTQFKRGLDRTASFDSELCLVKKDNYELNMWMPNPFYPGFKNQKLSVDKSEVIMTSRLDGASGQVVKRIINDSLEAEKQGLKGKAYFDARWKDPGNKKLSGYAFYDKSIHLCASHFNTKNIMPVVLEQTQELFGSGDCPDAAIYCGWYRLANYVDAFTWAKGSVGFHIASSECTTLKNKNSNVWCKKMLDKGIAATVGPVGEPYVQSFPVPALFFGMLSEGYLTLAESYMLSIPYLSWKMVLVGDPLYRLNIIN